jgi:hypothetical protein
MAQGNTYRFISDGGHGWAEIPTTAVLAAGIRPSSYSYYDPASGMTYLEEDCDVGRWLDASSNPDQAFQDVYVPGDCWVRDLPRWSQHTNDTDLGLTSTATTATHTVVLMSEVYGGETFTFDTLAEALACIGRLYSEASAADTDAAQHGYDGTSRVIGLVTNLDPSTIQVSK